jgi:hypothetical protein
VIEDAVTAIAREALTTRVGRASDCDEAQFVQDNELDNRLKDGARHLVFDEDTNFTLLDAAGGGAVRLEGGGKGCGRRGKWRGIEGEQKQVEQKKELNVRDGGVGARVVGVDGLGGAGGTGEEDCRLKRIARILQLGF